MRAQIILEWKLFIRNIKNQIVFFLFMFLSFYAAFVIEPNYVPWRSINAEIYESEIEDAEYFLANNDPVSNPRMYEMFSAMVDSNTQLIEEIKSENWKEVVKKEQEHYLNFVMLRYGDESIYRDPYFYNYNDSTYISELRQGYAEGYTAERYLDYQVSNVSLSQSIIEERTVIQTILRYMQNGLPALLIIIAILYAVDIIPKDLKHLSIVHNVPLSSYKNSWIKSIVVIIAYTVTLIVGFLFFAIPISLQHGFGPLNLPIPVYGWSYSDGHIWISSTIGAMFFQTILLLFLIVLIFIRGIACLNIFVKNSFINLLFIPFVFISNFWHSPGKTYVHAQYNYIPATYFRIGQALTGQLNYLYLSNLISFGTGFIVLFATFLLIELMNFSSLKLKRHFKGGKYEELFYV